MTIWILAFILVWLRWGIKKALLYILLPFVILLLIGGGYYLAST